MKKIAIILFEIIMLVSKTYGIEDPDGVGNYTKSILPPSPDSWSMTRVGFIQPNKFKGSASYSYPVYTFSNSHLSVPISLNYSSNGVKVDEMSSFVGLQWNLMAGGVINRIVRDDVDENSESLIPDNVNITSPDDAQKSIDFIRNGYGEGNDTEPDLYSYNFLGYSGQFVTNQNGNVKGLPITSLKIELEGDIIKVTDTNGIIYLFGENNSVEKSKSMSIGACGRSYTIPSITTWFITTVIHPAGDVIKFNYEDNNYSYYSGYSESAKELISLETCFNGSSLPLKNNTKCVSKIYTNSKVIKEIYSLNYGKVVFDYNQDRNDSEGKRLEWIRIINVDNIEVNKYKISHFYSQNVSYKNKNEVIINESKLSSRMYLDKITKYGVSEDIIEEYSFEYNNPNNLPARLSLSQDHWGYFNERVNTTFLPSGDYNGLFQNVANADRELNETTPSFGVLNRINYPTGGYQIIEYEHNSIYGQETVPAVLTGGYISTIVLGSDANISSTKVENFSVSVLQPDNKVTFNINLNYQNGISSLPNKDNVCIEIKDENDIIVESFIVYGTDPNKSIDVFIEENVIYSIKVTTTSFSVDDKYDLSGEINWSCLKNSSYRVPANIQTGGFRVKDLSIYSIDNLLTESKHFLYSDIIFDTAESKYKLQVKSSGITTGTQVNYSSFQRAIKRCSEEPIGSYIEGKYQLLNSSSNLPLFIGGSEVIYPSVIEKRIDNKGNINYQVSRYNYSIDLPGNLIFGEEYINNAPHNNEGYYNGELSSEGFFKYIENELFVVKTVEYDYSVLNNLNEILYGYTIRKNYDKIISHLGTHTCEEGDIGYWDGLVQCSMDHKHSLFTFINEVTIEGKKIGVYWCSKGEWFVPNTREEINNSPNWDWNWYVESPCDSVGEVLIDCTALEEYDVMRYNIYSKFRYLSKKKIINYSDNGQEFVTEESYSYENIESLLPSKIVSKTSLNNVVKTNYNKYPSDFIESYSEYNNFYTKIKGLGIKTKSPFNIIFYPVEANINLSGLVSIDESDENYDPELSPIKANIFIFNISKGKGVFSSEFTSGLINETINLIPGDKYHLFVSVYGSPMEVELTVDKFKIEYIIDGIRNQIEKNMISNIISNSIVEDDKFVRKIDFKYNDFNLIKKIYVDTSIIGENYFFDPLNIYKNNYQVLEKKYSEKGNLIQQDYKESTFSYLWGYNKTKPVAKIDNAKPDDVIYNSFEYSQTSGEATWWNNTITSTDYAYSGSNSVKVANGAYGPTATIFPSDPFKKYIATAWIYVPETSNPSKIRLSFSANNEDEYIEAKNVYVSKPGWQQLKVELDLRKYKGQVNAGEVELRIFTKDDGGGKHYIDEIRLYPVDAQMTTYTYKPLVGVTSITDSRGEVTRYEYDDFGRLKFVKDKDGNVLKHNSYHYYNESVESDQQDQQ